MKENDPIFWRDANGTPHEMTVHDFIYEKDRERIRSFHEGVERVTYGESESDLREVPGDEPDTGSEKGKDTKTQ